MQFASISPNVATRTWPRADPAQVTPPVQSAKANPADEQSAARSAPQPPQDAAGSTNQTVRTLELAEQLDLSRMIKRDQEVRQHEQAHASVGGRHAGAPSYTYERGPDGKRYAVAGEVSIDVSALADDPQATVRKMQQVVRAALAPAEPSAQDRQIAAQAQTQMAQAITELAQLRLEEADAARRETGEGESSEVDSDVSQSPAKSAAGTGALELYQAIRAGADQPPLIDLSI